MPKVIMNELVKALRGKLGDVIFRQMPDGSVVVSAAPERRKRKRRGTGKQRAYRARFKQAAAYGSSAAGEHPIYAELASKARRSPYHFALADWLKAPVIQCLERQDGRIRVLASDNIMVQRVRVTVLDQDGGLLEQGEALRAEGDWWEFASGADGKTIMAEAWDLPGNVSQFVLS